jgi:tetratricopeptide (TPR) repeat protein
MRIATLCLAAIAGPALFAQSPSQLKLPNAIGHIANAGGAAPATTASDMITRYASRREAAIAALKAGNDAAAVSRGPERALGLFMLAARRDPGFATALYDLGVMCTREERWEDAINFYQEAAMLDKSAEMARLTQAEISRVQLIASLERTPEGRRTREFDIKFLSLAAKQGNPASSLEEAAQLAKTDANRWEVQALIGSLQATVGKFDDSARALDAAGKLAPPERRKALVTASELARREATFESLLRAANENWEKQQYDAAARAYANAWETSPARDRVGMQAATAFLMVDEVPLAVQTLAKLQQTGGPETNAKAGLMLKELGAVSEEAKQLAQVNSGSARPEAVPDIGERVQALLGDLTSPEMRTAAKGNPPLLRDDTRFVDVSDDELTSSSSDVLLMSTQSIFQMYRKAVPADQSPVNPQGGISEPGAPTGDIPAAPAPEAAPATVPGHPQKLDSRPSAPPEPDRAAAGSPRGTTMVASVPEGASVILDNASRVSCTTPCQVQLGPGRHTLQATMQGYRDLQKIFEVPESGTASVELPFSAKRGTVFIQTTNPGAEIVVDGQKTGRKTPADMAMNEGPHKIEVVAGSKVDSTDVTVRDNDLLRVSF